MVNSNRYLENIYIISMADCHSSYSLDKKISHLMEIALVKIYYKNKKHGFLFRLA